MVISTKLYSFSARSWIGLVLIAALGCANASDELVTVEHVVEHASVDGFYSRQNIDPNISLYVREVVAKNGIESAVEAEKVIVLIHGATFPSEVAFDLAVDNASIMRALANSGWDVFAMDLEGYGKSTRPAVMDTPDAWPAEPAPGAPEVMDASVDAVVDFVRELRGIDKVHMLGWSAGATLEVPRYAVEHPDKLRKIVLYGVRYQNKSRTEEEVAEILKENDANKNRMADPTAPDIWAGLGTEADMVIPGLFDVYTPLHLASDPLAEKNGNQVRAPWGRFAPFFNQATMQQPDRITVPTLIIRGEHDTFAVLEDNQKLFDALPGDANKLVTIEGGGHFLHMENVNLAFYEALNNFLGE